VSWTVETLDERVDREIEAWEQDQRVALARIIALIKAIGIDRVREPHVKHIEGRVWEMRPRAKSGIARALYVTIKGRRIIILRAFVKKTQATPRREIEIAKARAAELEARER
jgi:phage-related protein